MVGAFLGPKIMLMLTWRLNYGGAVITSITVYFFIRGDRLWENQTFGAEFSIEL